MKAYFFLFLFFFSLGFTSAQELNCNVDINYQQIQGTTNKQIFEQMKRSIFDFMNNTKWLNNDVFAPVERIECTFLIIVKEVLGTDEYNATIQVTSRRPVYKSSYYSQVLNIEDEDFQFKFNQFSPLEFNINVFQNNLTSVLQYYAYAVIAADYDSFSLQGGTPAWQKCQLIVQNAQNAPEKGWRQNEKGEKNRYWLIENTLQPVFKGIRECNYQYFRNGMDMMHQDPALGRANILKALQLLLPIYRSRPANFNTQVFFNSHREEIINVFRNATPEEKTQVLELLSVIDPAGTTRYSRIQGS